jgi:N-acetylmuramoyl-L-alanine amidase
MEKRVLLTVISIALSLASLAGCGGPKTAYDSLYAELSEDILVPDASVLAGRRIVIDPGHGGEYDGAIGADSLTEAEVNLGVALYLWGLLREAGADVHLTRSSDRDFLPDSLTGPSPAGGADGDGPPVIDLGAYLREDLRARSDSANKFEPEVFVSIHHNSNIALDRERNAIEVYYRGTDYGASLELAEDLHTHLARNLGITRTAIKPGNYFVLRNSEAGAAVLGEASYISNPGVEEKIRLSAKQKLEAEAYYLGLVSYFSRGVPAIAMTVPAADTLSAPSKIEFRVEPGAGIDIDRSSCEARINGRRVPCFFPAGEGGPFCLMPSGMANGRFTVSLTVRSIRGATATFGPEEMLLDREPRFFLPMPVVPGTDGEKLLRVLVLDSGGRPVADGRVVKLEGAEGGAGLTAGTRKGKALFVTGSAEGEFTISSGRATDSIVFGDAEEGTRLLTVVIDARTGDTVGNAVMLSGGGKAIEGTRSGRIVSHAADTAGAYIHARGYRPAPFGRGDEGSGGSIVFTNLTPIYDGILHGKRIVIDPGGGGAYDAGRGPRSLRGATVNLRLAKELESTLTAAGAAVKLTRRGEEELSDEQRVFRTNRFGADLAISLRYGTAPVETGECEILHYPGSAAGKPAADTLAAVLAGTPPCAGANASESVDLFLLQTNCPALILSGGSLADPDTETLFDSPRWTRMKAEKIVESLIRVFGEME